MEDFGCEFSDVGRGLIPVWVSGLCSVLWGGCVRDNVIITAPGLETSFLADHGKPSGKIKSCVPKDKRLILNFMRAVNHWAVVRAKVRFWVRVQTSILRNPFYS